MKSKMMVGGVLLGIGCVVILAIVGRKDGAGDPVPPQTAPSQHPFAGETSVSTTVLPAPGLREGRADLVEEPRSSTEYNALGIASGYVEQGMRDVEILSANLRESMTADRDYYHDMFMTEDKYPVRKLSLRLGLDEDETEKLSDILSAHADVEMQRYADAEQDEMAQRKLLLETDYEGYVNYLALRAMSANGEALSSEQSLFYQKYREKLGYDSAPVVPWQREAWNQNSEVMQAIETLLPAEQWEGVLLYLEEQELREVDTQAFMRSTQLADTLGLDEVGRTALYKYLQENPDVSNEQLSGQLLSPEFRELMPAE